MDFYSRVCAHLPTEPSVLPPKVGIGTPSLQSCLIYLSLLLTIPIHLLVLKHWGWSSVAAAPWQSYYTAPWLCSIKLALVLLCVAFVHILLQFCSALMTSLAFLQHQCAMNDLPASFNTIKQEQTTTISTTVHVSSTIIGRLKEREIEGRGEGGKLFLLLKGIQNKK